MREDGWRGTGKFFFLLFLFGEREAEKRVMKTEWLCIGSVVFFSSWWNRGDFVCLPFFAGCLALGYRRKKEREGQRRGQGVCF